MATWNSNVHFIFNEENTQYPSESDSYSWEYHTTSDILSVIEYRASDSECSYTGTKLNLERERRHLFGHSQAEALYMCLRHWILRYQGGGKLEKLDEQVLDLIK